MEERTCLLHTSPQHSDESAKVTQETYANRRLCHPRLWNWKNHSITVCLWVAYLFVSAAFSTVGPFFPIEAEKKGTSSTVTGFIISCSSLCEVFLSPVVGYFLPHFGLRFTLLSGLFLVGGSFILLGFVSMMPAGSIFIVFCVLLRMTEGVGSAMFVTAMFTLLPTLYPTRVGTVMGVFEVSGGLGFAVGPVIGGLLYKLGGSRLPFVSVGVLILLFITPSFLLVRHSRCSSRKLPLKTLWKLITNFGIFVLALSNVLFLASLSFFTPTLEPFLKKQFNSDPLQVGLVFLIESFTYMLVSLIIGPIVDRVLTPRYVILPGFFLLGFGHFFIGPAVFISSPRIWITCVAFAAIGVGEAFGTIPIYSDMLTIAKKDLDLDPEEDKEALTGVLSGVISSTISFGEFIGPLIGGTLTQFFDFQTSSLLYGEVLLAQGFLVLGVTLIDQLCKLRS